MKGENEARLREFKKRVAEVEGDRKHGNRVIVLSHRDWEYIPVHPFADEAEVLKQLKWSPEKCIHVDCYWRVRNDVVFIEVMTTEYTTKKAGLYARWDQTHKPYMLYLSAVTTERMIKRDTVETFMVKFDEIGIDTITKAKRSMPNTVSEINPPV